MGTLTADNSSANLTIMDTLHNEAIRGVISTKQWGYRQKSVTFATETANLHQLPADFGGIVNVTVTIGSTKYSPYQVLTNEEWDVLTQSTATTSNTPEAYFIFGKTLSFYPAPSSATANAVALKYNREQKDLSVADYSTGSIVSVANLGTAVVGTGTTWTSQMAGRYIRITDSNTANTGDGYWYEIASVTSATALTLVAPYNGTAIAAGTAPYVIGQVSIIPEDHQMTPIYRACEIYWTTLQPEVDRSTLFKNLYLEGMKRMNIDSGSVSL